METINNTVTPMNSTTATPMNSTTPTKSSNSTTVKTTTTPSADDDYITVVEVEDRASKDINLHQHQLVTKNQQQQPQLSAEANDDSSYITVLTINNQQTQQQQQMHSKNNSGGSVQSDGSIRVNGANGDESGYDSRGQTNGASSQAINKAEVKAVVESDTELLTVHRQPGERLGFGLKFQGGTRSAEKVHKLFIQSCAVDSPAAKVRASWGALREGDEIVSIDGQRVCELTRIECVRCLKDNVAIKLQVRNGYGRKPDTEEEVMIVMSNTGATTTTMTTVDGVMNGGCGGGIGGTVGDTITISNGQMKGIPPPPPPVPPRKLVKRKSLNGEGKVVIAHNAAEHINNNNSSDGSPTPGNTNTPTNANAAATAQPSSHNDAAVEKPFTPPPDAEYYINLFADGQSLKTESESDDTASTISTVIDKFSMSSNYSSESDLSSYTTPSLTNGQSVVINKSELAKVLKPFTLLEQEFNVNVNGSAAPELEQCLKEVIDESTASTGGGGGDVMPDLLASAMTAAAAQAQAQAQKPMSFIAGHNYENVALKTEKINSYENVELKLSPPGQSGGGGGGAAIVILPTPKPRQAMAPLEPKRRSIIPTPRKIATPTKLPIHVAPPVVPSSAKTPMKTPPNTPATPATASCSAPLIPFKFSTPTTAAKQSTSSTAVTPSTTQTYSTTPTISTTQTNSTTSTPSKLKTPATPQTPKSDNPTTPANTPTTPSYEPSTHTTKEFITKIPKAIATVFGPNSQRSFERAKTESEIKLKQSQQSPLMSASIKEQTALFLDKECHSSSDSVASTIRKPTATATTTASVEKTKATELSSKVSSPKSRIPVVVMSPKHKLSSAASTSPSNIPRFLTHKQKSETDLKLGLYRSKSKELSPPLSLKIPLQRTNSAESKLKSPERTLIPVFSGQSQSADAMLNSYAQASAATAATSTPTKVKGPKPKPPERVQSLAKTPPTHIPKLHTPTAATGGAAADSIKVTLPNTPPTPTTAPQNQMPTMQTFKQQPINAAATSSTPNREIRFKIQTYESKVQEPRTPFTVVNDNEDEKMPSLFDLVRKNSPEGERKDDAPLKNLSTFKPSLMHKQALQLESSVDDDDEDAAPPAVVGKCIKVSDSQPTYYSSSSEEDDENEERNGGAAVDNYHDIERDYECEEGEKLGPPEVINGPGPSEAYFNLYWQSNMLPTIGEVEEELSSLEPQSLPNGPIVIVDDLSQQQQGKQSDTKIEKPNTKELKDSKKEPQATKAQEHKTTTEGQINFLGERSNSNHLPTTAANNNKSRKPPFIGVPVKPPSVPKMEEENSQEESGAKQLEATATTTTTNGDDKAAAENNNATMKEQINENESKADDKINVTAVEAAVNYQNGNDGTKQEPRAATNGTEIYEKYTTEITKTKQVSEIAEAEMQMSVKSREEEERDEMTEEKVQNVNRAEKELNVEQNLKESKIEMAEKTKTVKSSSSSSSNSSSHVSESHIEKTTAETLEQKSATSLQTTELTQTQTTTTKKQVTNSTTTTCTELHETNTFDKLDGLTQEKRTVLEKGGKVTSTQSSAKTSSTEQPTNKPIAFSLQPYTERISSSGTPRVTVYEERKYENKENAYTEIRTRDANTGEEKLQTSAESHKEHAKLKNVHSHEDELAQLGIEMDDDDEVKGEADGVARKNNLKPMTVTATAETRISEQAENPQDKQSIERGILNLSESGKQLQRSIGGGVAYTECEHQVHDSYEDMEQIVKGGGDELDKAAEKKEPTLLRELSETLTVTKGDGDKQVTRRSETTKETPTKKGAKILKKTEDERRLELEAQKLIESYQKVKKEAEKLFQHELCEDEGFDFGDGDKQRNTEEREEVSAEKVEESEEKGKGNEAKKIKETAESTKVVPKEETMEGTKVMPKEETVEGTKVMPKEATGTDNKLEKTNTEASSTNVEKQQTILKQEEQITEQIMDTKEISVEPRLKPALSPVSKRLDIAKLTAAFLQEERRFMALEKVNREEKKQDKLEKKVEPHKEGVLKGLIQQKLIKNEEAKKELIQKELIKNEEAKQELIQRELIKNEEAKQELIPKEQVMKELMQKEQTKNKQQPQQFTTTNTSPNLLDAEPIYVLHKNIIKEPTNQLVVPDELDDLDATPEPPELSKFVEINEYTEPIELEVELPTSPEQPFEAVEIIIKENLPTPTSKRKLKSAEEGSKKVAKPNTPPTPKKRSEKEKKSSISPKTTHTPKKRGSIDKSSDSRISASDADEQASEGVLGKLPIKFKKMKVKKEQQPIAVTEKELQGSSTSTACMKAEQNLERIIVGIEQQQFNDNNNKPAATKESTTIITLDSNKLPTEMATVVGAAEKQVVANVLSSGAGITHAADADLHLETINLPNESHSSSSLSSLVAATTKSIAAAEEKLRKSERVGDGMQMPEKTTTTKITTATKAPLATTSSMSTPATTFVSTSSSADSMQSVIEIGGDGGIGGGIVQSPSEDELGHGGMATDTSEEGE